MTRFSLLFSLLLAACVAAPPAGADVVTLGSDLQAPATIVQTNQADTAFWPSSVNGADPAAPADGQVLSIRIKGMAIRPAGAPAPLNEVHFQTLDAAGGGNYKVYLSSAPFLVPYEGDANQISEYKPDNLCMHQGGVLDFNDEGGWDGTDTGPYKLGVPFRVFGSAGSSSTSWFSKDGGTKNDAMLAPPNLLRGTELLLQYTLATGDDRSYECGGPLRDDSGKAIANMKVTPGQDAYVSSDGSFTVFGYCGDARADCNGGTATVSVNGVPVGTGTFNTAKQNSIKIPMKLATADFAKLAASPGGAWTATLTLVTPSQGTVTGDIKMHTKGGGVLHVVTPQKVYVRSSRVITPAGFCGLPTGCSGTAALTVNGKVVATAKFATRTKGAIRVTMKVPASVYKQAKKKPVAAKLALTGALGSAAGTILLRR